MGRNVFDITTFKDDHPGGSDLITKYAGKDVTDIMRDETSHRHSEAAYNILQAYHTGFTACDAFSDLNESFHGPNGAKSDEISFISREDDLCVVTDCMQETKNPDFLALNKPLLPQMWSRGFSKDFYLEQIHQPIHCRTGESPPLFGNFLEPLSKTAWYVVPVVWLPPVTYGTIIGYGGLEKMSLTCTYWVLGLFLWTLIEYLMHRFLFHLDR